MVPRPALTAILLGSLGVLPAPVEAQLIDRIRDAARQVGDALGQGVDSIASRLEGGGELAPLGVSPKETLLGPVPPSHMRAGSIFVSEDGETVLVVAERGSRKVMFLNGVEGPVFDDIGGIHLGWTTSLSDTGGRSAYLGRRGEEHIAVIDGEEVGPAFYGTIPYLPTQPGGHSRRVFHFSQDGSRLAYPVVSAQGEWRMVVDGETGPPFAEIDIDQVRVRGDRVAYVGTSSEGSEYAVVDGVMTPAYDDISSLIMTEDGTHYVFVGRRGDAVHLVTDGVEGPAGQAGGDLLLAPDGRVAYVAMRTVPGGRTPIQVLFVDGVEVTDRPASLEYGGLGAGPRTGAFSPLVHGTTAPGTLRVWVAFSPDGRRFAYARREANGVRVVVDGQPGLEYGGIRELHFSADGSRVAYVGSGTGANSFVVVDGEELTPGGNIQRFQFSPDGRRFAYEVSREGKNFMVLDGEAGPPLWPTPDLHGVFSPDGAHFAYVGCPQMQQCELVRDGERLPGQIGSFSQRDTRGWGGRPAGEVPALLFSPDGTRLAYIVKNAGGPGGNAVFVDKENAGSGSLIGYAVFSSDSRHFASAVWVNQAWQIVVNGRVGPIYPDLVEFGPNALRFLDDNTLRVLAVKDDSIYRVVLELDD
jgi:hypothetical protein